MSKEQIQSFLEEVKANPDLRQKLNAIKADKLSAIKAANDSGYDFTADEWDDFLNAQMEAQNVKLSDDELASASGGLVLADGTLIGEELARRCVRKTFDINVCMRCLEYGENRLYGIRFCRKHSIISPLPR